MTDNIITLYFISNFNLAKNKKRARKTGRETQMEEGSRKERGREIILFILSPSYLRVTINFEMFYLVVSE